VERVKEVMVGRRFRNEDAVNARPTNGWAACRWPDRSRAGREGKQGRRPLRRLGMPPL